MGRGVFTSERDTGRYRGRNVTRDRDEPGRQAYLDKTLLHDYIFEWGKNKDQCCMALGLVPIYNHSYASNCEYFMDYEEDTVMLKSVREIEEGEELTINYNGDWNDSKEIWFNAR